jgi:ATP-dependent RNA helicase RhlE
MLFSATMPSEIAKIAATHMKLPVRVEVAQQGTAAERVTQELYVVRKDEKPRLLEHLLREVRGSVLVFTRTKFGAKKLARALSRAHAAIDIHSDRSLSQRREALAGFKSGKYRVLVATDIAARGIDVTGIEMVINYDLPDQAEDYVHRIGRTGRAGHEGRAVSFAMPDQGADVRQIEKLVRMQLPIAKLPAGLPVLPPPPPPAPGESRREREGQGGRGGYQGGSRGGHQGGGRRPPGRSSHDDRRGFSKGGSNYADASRPSSLNDGRSPGSAAPPRAGGGAHGRPQGGGRKKFNERSRRTTDPVEGHPDRWQPPASHRRGKTKRPI